MTKSLQLRKIKTMKGDIDSKFSINKKLKKLVEFDQNGGSKLN